MSPQFFYHFPIGSRNASSTKTLIFILKKISVFQLVAFLEPIGNCQKNCGDIPPIVKFCVEHAGATLFSIGSLFHGQKMMFIARQSKITFGGVAA